MEINPTKNIGSGLHGLGHSSRNALIEIILLAIVGFLFAWFIVLPKRAQVAEKRIELAKVEQEESQTATKLATLQKLTQGLKTSGKQIADLEQTLPLDGKITKLQILIDTLAKSVGVEVGDITISGTGQAVDAGDKALLSNPYAASRSLKKMSGSVYVIGTFGQLQAFLQKVETSARLMDVTALTIDTAPEGKLNLRITLNAYYFAP